MAEMSLVEGLDRLDRRAKLARLCCFAFMPFAIFAGLGMIGEAIGAIDLAAGALDLPSALIALSYVLVFLVRLVSMVFTAMWIYRAHANLRAAGMEDLHYSPGWAVGWFFVPLANLFKPFDAMRELWKASNGAGGFTNRDVSATVGLWWGCWIVGNILSNFSERFNMPGLAIGSMAGALGFFVLAAAAWFLAAIIGEIGEAQRSTLAAALIFA